MKSSLNEFHFLIYKAEKENVTAQVFVMDETVWLTQRAIAELFGVEVNTVNYHLKEIFSTHELDEASTIRKIRIVQSEGGRQVAREVIHYNLDAIISVGYRVNSIRATHFRIWATNVLREYMKKGFCVHHAGVFGKYQCVSLISEIRYSPGQRPRLSCSGAGKSKPRI